ILFALLAVLIVAIPVSVIAFMQQQQSPQGSKAPATVFQYEKLELTYPFSGSYSNPNDPAIVDVEAVFTAPDGNKQTVPGFFFQDFTRSGDVTKEILTPIPQSERWKVRYAPSDRKSVV